MAIDTTSLASLLDALKAWLQANPDGDLQEFAAEHDCTVEDVSDAWSTYFTADFSRDYDLNTTQGGSQGAHYSPAPPPLSATPVEYKEYLTQEINNYQQFTTINNIEDNSFNQQIIAGGEQQIIAGGDVNQDIDIDNSDNSVGGDGVLVRDSNLDDTAVNAGNVNFGDRAVQDSEGVLTGDVTTEAGEGGQAQTGINFGKGDLQQNQQDQDVEINKSGGDTGGDGGSADGTGGAGTGTGGGGAGGDADADATGGDGAGGILDGGDGGADAEADAEAGGGDGGGDGGTGDGGDAGDGGDNFDVSQTGPAF